MLAWALTFLSMAILGALLGATSIGAAGFLVFALFLWGAIWSLMEYRRGRAPGAR
jgi:hypothetical protein